MKRFLCLLFSVILILSFSGCAVIFRELAKREHEEFWEEEETEYYEETSPETPTINFKEQVVFEQSDIRITAKSIESDGFDGYDLKLLLENNSSENITVTIELCSLNGIMLNDFIYTDMRAGKKANETISASSYDLERLGITEIGEFEFLLSVDDEDYNTVIEGTPVTVTVDENYVQENNCEGTIVYDDGEIVITATDFTDDTFGGYDIYFAVQNNRSTPITVSFNNICVNDYAVSGFFYSNIASGKVAKESLSIYKSDLEDNDIVSLEQIEFEIEIRDSLSYDVIVQTEPVILTNF